MPESLITSLADRGITAPFPIQVATLPDSLAGRDVLGRGRTGSGKTLAFAIPVVTRLAPGRRAEPSRPRALVLAPTRELANQITETLAPLAKAARLSITTIFGGVGQGKQVSALRGGIDILVACPGRLEDLMGQKLVSLDGVEITVLDEADHMADLGFLPGVTRIMRATPAVGQRLLFSATLDNGVDVLVKRFLDKPVTHSVDPASSPVAALTHHLFEVGGAEEKKDIVEALASGRGRRLLFMRTKHQARQMARRLTAAGIPATDLHGNLSQGARERNLAAFHSGDVRVMVATDIAARGIHVDDVDLVVHVDPPAEHKAYLHRSGRTARAGAGGDVVTLVLPEQRGDVRQLTRAAKITATPQRVRATDAAVTALVGEVAPRVAPGAMPAGAATKPEPQQPRRKGAGGGSGRSAQGGQGGQGGRGRQGGQEGQTRAAVDGGASAPSGEGSGGGRRRGRGRGRGAAGAAAPVGASARTSEGRPSGGRGDGGARGGESRGGGQAAGAPGGQHQRRGQRSAAKGPKGESRGGGVRGSGARSGGGAGGRGKGRGSAPVTYSTSTGGGGGFVQMTQR
ncbi:DEAD/DEAH box helicase [Litorihabitans aurantiacus]|uniref:DEAD/DEAH box helicase n=1 Tax=Litorihabitans aurantiacus TaxID=1930061 RepID=UPI0024E0F19E|nr:DEAD/DEAH box helicase [Litorihabitans aurantiacus]